MSDPAPALPDPEAARARSTAAQAAAAGRARADTEHPWPVLDGPTRTRLAAALSGTGRRRSATVAEVLGDLAVQADR